MSAQPLASVTSLKVKLGLLVAISVVVAALVGAAGGAAGVTFWLTLPVTIVTALALTQLLAAGMIAPLREMTAAARQMAGGDYRVRVTATSRDEVGELARTFNTMAHDLAEVDQQRRELVANVSHELRTPLTGLCAVLENVVDGVGPADPDSLTPALAQAQRMAGLVDDLLDLARVDAGRAPLKAESVALGPLLEDAVAECALLGRDVTFDLEVEPDDLEVRADPARLHQLVANLLDNASRHSPAGAAVRIGAARHGQAYRLEVSDQGPGIAPADRDAVFEAFGTLRGAGETGGTGLGLAIARWVTDLHGGAIRFVDPADGESGARVRVELPLEPREREAAAVLAAPRPPAPVTPSPAAPSYPQAVPPPAATISAPSLVDDLVGTFWPDRGTPARLAILISAVATGLFGALVLPERALGLGTFFVLLTAGGVVFAATGERRDRFTLACAVLCVLLASVVVVRDAEWIAVLCLLAGGALCIAGATRARSLLGFILSGLAWPFAGLRGLPWLGRTLNALTGLGRPAALVRTLVWSVLVLVIFGALFASADALVAEWFDALVPDLSIDMFVARAFLTVAIGGAVLAAAYVALNPPQVDRDGTVVRTGGARFEWLAPVAVVNVVFATFLVAQATVVFGGHAYLQRTTGHTYADYVHRGFGQLTVATALMLVVVWAASQRAPRETVADRAWLRGALGLLCAQTLVVVASALYRMHVYQEAYGFTSLRVLVDVFEAWLGLVVLAVVVSGIALRGRWLPRFALLSGAIVLLGLAAANPDGWVAERNVDRYVETGKIDWDYLGTLSDDATPSFARLPEHAQHCILGFRHANDDDWLEWNLGRALAKDLLDRQPATPPQNCPGSTG